MKRHVLLRTLIAALLIALLCPAALADEIPAERTLPRFANASEATAMSDEDYNALNAKFDALSEELNFDIAVVTVDSIGEYSGIESFADDVYDYYGYGMGEEADGALLLVDMGGREVWITTCGYGITAVTDAGIDYILDQIVPDIGAGNYYDGFSKYADIVAEMVKSAREGNIYDTYTFEDGSVQEGYGYTEKRSSPLKNIVPVVIGVISGFLTTLGFKGQLSSVSMRSDADEYLKEKSFRLTDRQDRFVTRTLNRTPRPKETRSGGGPRAGGSSIHVSSSGRSHGGGGRRF